MSFKQENTATISKKKLTAEEIRQRRKKRAKQRRQRILRGGDARIDYVKNRITKQDLEEEESKNQSVDVDYNKNLTDSIDVCLSIMSNTFFPEQINNAINTNTFENISLKKSLTSLQTINEKDRDGSIAALSSMFSNILKYPCDQKYHSFDYNAISHQFQKCPMCIDILYAAGFTKSEDGKRIRFQYNNMRLLVKAHKSLQKRFIKHIQPKPTTDNDEKAKSNKKSKEKRIIDDDKKTNSQQKSMQQTLINSSRLLESHRRINVSYNSERGYHVDDQCILKECKSLKSIAKILLLYHQLINNSNSVQIDDLYEKQNDYNDVKLINDYHHLLSKHSHEFEEIYCRLFTETANNQICQLSACYMLQRNHRDRSNLSIKDSSIKQMYLSANTNNIARQQLLDSMHCHYFHSVDTGYRISRVDGIGILREVCANSVDSNGNDTAYSITSKLITNLTSSKRNMYRNTKGLERMTRTNYNKFSTVTTQNDEKDEKQDNTYYSFGYRYFYWDYYKNNGNSVDEVCRSQKRLEWNINANEYYALHDWYVEPMFNNLKDELLNNNISTISELQWRIHVIKANIYQKSLYFKQIKCRKLAALIDTFDIYGIDVGDAITCYHIIAMMIYCNQTELQHKFSATYRRIPHNESNESLKKRHSNFYHLGRLLRELVECFGTKEFSFGLIDTAFYTGHLFHGISNTTQLGSVDVPFKGPTSTTTDYTVAANFCGDTGIIIEFKLDFCWNYTFDVQQFPYFDCRWLSDFTNEKEIFFIGGYRKLSITTLIMKPSGHDYSLYCKAILQIFRSLDGIRRGTHATPDGDKEEQLFLTLLNYIIHRYEKTNAEIPEYIKTLIHKQCENVTTIRIEEYTAKNKFRHNAFRSIFFSQDLIDLDLLTNVFPALQHVVVNFNSDNENMKMLKSESFWEYIRQLIEQKHLRYLNRIEVVLNYDNNNKELLNNMVCKYDESLKQLGWIVCNKTNEVKRLNAEKCETLMKSSDKTTNEDLLNAHRAVLFHYICIEKINDDDVSLDDELIKLRKEIEKYNKITSSSKWKEVVEVD